MSLLTSHITFGVEIECIIGHLRDFPLTAQPESFDITDALYAALTPTGLPLEEDDDPRTYAGWSITTDVSIHIRNSRQMTRTTRRVLRTGPNQPVHNDRLVFTQEGRTAMVDTREIVSRIFTGAELARGGFTRELKTVLGLLHDPPRWWVGYTKNCGLHVHVGLPVQNPVLAPHCLGPLRRLAVLSIVCERAMEGIATRAPDLDYAEAIGERYFHPMMPADEEVCEYVLRTRTIYDLQQAMLSWRQDTVRFESQRVKHQRRATLWAGERYFRMAFQPLASQRGHGEQGHGTVEFRVHQGTVGRMKIEMWVKVCVGMVRTCAEMGDTELRMLLRREGGRGMGTRRFLECFVRDPEAVEYYVLAQALEGDEEMEDDTSDRDCTCPA